MRLKCRLEGAIKNINGPSWEPERADPRLVREHRGSAGNWFLDEGVVAAAMISVRDVKRGTASRSALAGTIKCWCL